MAKSKVAIIRCKNYEPETVYISIKKALSLIGEMSSFVKKGEKILLKPNILAGRNPELVTTTHPAIFEATVRLLKEEGVEVSYGDSPGFDPPIVALKKSGITDIAEKYNVKLADFERGKKVDYPDGYYGKQFDIAFGVLEADGIISLSKMKSHQLTRITGAVKNQFGCINGLNKARFHVKIPNATNFSKMLVELTKFLKPRLYIMDGVIAMQGNGPASGEPVNMNCIIVSADPVAVDSVFCRMVNLPPEYIPTNVYGNEIGLGNCDFSEIELVGDDIETFVKKDFDIPHKPVKDNAVFKFLLPLKNLITPRPVIKNNKCVKCGICVKACPVEPKAVFFKNDDNQKSPIYDYKKCIRCYCCQEVCPHKAISVKTPLLGKIFG